MDGQKQGYKIFRIILQESTVAEKLLSIAVVIVSFNTNINITNAKAIALTLVPRTEFLSLSDHPTKTKPRSCLILPNLYVMYRYITLL